MGSFLPKMVATGLAALLLASCTEEKAQGLLAAANRFRTETATAIEAIKTVYQFDYQAGKEPDPARGFYAAARKAGVSAEDLVDGLYAPTAAQETEKAVGSTIDQLNVRYVLFAESLQELPRAPQLAAPTIPCVAEMGKVLVADLTRLPEVLDANLKQPSRRLRESISRIRAQKDDAEGLRIAQEAVAHFDERRRLRDEAVKQIGKATLAGRDAIKLAAQYDQLTVEDMLVLINQGLELATLSLKADVSQTEEQLASLRAAIQSDPHWAAVAALPVGKQPAACESVK